MTPERDNATGLFPVEAITPGVLSADQAGALIALSGFRTATLLLHVGIGGIAFSNANRINVVLTHGDAADGSDQVPVADIDVLVDGAAAGATPVADGIVRAIAAPKPAADVQKVGYVGGRAFLKVTVDFAGAHATGTPIAAIIVRGSAAIEGVA